MGGVFLISQVWLVWRVNTRFLAKRPRRVDKRRGFRRQELFKEVSMEQVTTQVATQEVAEHVEVDRWDKVGMFLSALCALHCLLTPILMITLPLMAEKFEDPLVHIVLALFVVPVGCYAFLSGFKHHHNKSILITGLVGVFIVGMTSILPIFVEHFHEVEIPLMILGSLILLAAHFQNRKSCACEHKH